MKIHSAVCLAAAALSGGVTSASAGQSIGVYAGVAGVFIYREVPTPLRHLCEAGRGRCTTAAACVLNVDPTGAVCDASSSCTVNAAVPDVPPFLTGSPWDGVCQNGGSCTVNIGNCNGGACLVNAGECTNGDTSDICLNVSCDNAGPHSEGAAGRWCALDVADNGASGPLFSDPTKEFGLVTAAVRVYVSDPTTNTVSDVSITCTMQSTPNRGDGGVSRSVTQSGSSAVLVDTISFNRVPLAPSYLCSQVDWNSTKGHTTLIRDADNDGSNGWQCQEINYTN